MGIRILEGDYDGTTSGAVMVDSVTDWAFGPLFDNEQEAELFISWNTQEHGDNLIRVSRDEMEERFSQFRKLATTCDECGDWIIGECKNCQEDDDVV